MRLKITGAAVAALATFAAVTLAAPAVLPQAASAATAPPGVDRYTTNWAGYWATAPAGKHIWGVMADVIVPTVNCAGSRGLVKPYQAAFWAGLGGGNDAPGLVQTGVLAQCNSKTAKPGYLLWWEVEPGTGHMVPYLDAAGHTIHVKPGQQIALTVLTPAYLAHFGMTGGDFEMAVQVFDGPQAGFYPVYQPLTGPLGQTAEVITERTSCGDTLACMLGLTGLTGLADMGQVVYVNQDVILSNLKKALVSQHPITLRRLSVTGWHNLVVPFTQPIPGGGCPLCRPEIVTQRTGRW